MSKNLKHVNRSVTRQHHALGSHDALCRNCGWQFTAAWRRCHLFYFAAHMQVKWPFKHWYLAAKNVVTRLPAARNHQLLILHWVLLHVCLCPSHCRSQRCCRAIAVCLWGGEIRDEYNLSPGSTLPYAAPGAYVLLAHPTIKLLPLR